MPFRRWANYRNQFSGGHSTEFGADFGSQDPSRLVDLPLAPDLLPTKCQKISRSARSRPHFTALRSGPLGLARALVREGDTSNARIAYQDFFALWKDADPDIPILKEAKAEYAKFSVGKLGGGEP
jgi:hypothetical protein